MSDEDKIAPDATTGSSGESVGQGSEEKDQGAVPKNAEALFGDLSNPKEEKPESSVEESASEETAEEKASGTVEEDAELAGLTPDTEVPEKPFEGKIGDYTFKLPAGLKADDPQFKQFADVLKQCEVKGEKAQGMLDLFIENRRKAGEELMAMDQKFRESINEKWISQNKADPEIGGTHIQATANYVQKALRTIFTKEELMQTSEKDGAMGFLEFIQKANIKNATPLVKLLSRVGKKLGESKPITSGAPAEQRAAKSRKDTMFGEI